MSRFDDLSNFIILENWKKKVKERKNLIVIRKLSIF